MDISELTRRNLIDYLLIRDKPIYGDTDLISFLKRTWNLTSMPSTDSRYKNAEGDIWQHMVNNDDWEYEELLNKRLKLLDCEDKIFILFLENCVHPVVLRDVSEQMEAISELNELLKPDSFRLEESSKISGRSVYKVIDLDSDRSTGSKKEKYEVVLSFAGENREYVEKVAEYLRDHNIKLFYDDFEEVNLWGKELTEYFDEVYRGSARYCVIFISKYYKDKLWPNHERRSALARALEEKEEYILPARFDDTEIPGIRPTVGYVDLSKKTPEALGKMIIQKLGRIM